MFGQSALHLAIVHDDYETVQLLLSKDADVNARARGNFFLPEESKGGKMMDYQGYAYYGEYPLAFAACFGNKDIYDLLIQHKADPDLQDVYGNTILHMCVINYSNVWLSYLISTLQNFYFSRCTVMPYGTGQNLLRRIWSTTPATLRLHWLQDSVGVRFSKKC
ncbi:hypothetical protein L596_004294 [Steinernema carpocapsae]|uniref:Uncharacterized protein n=1 Tax=Steinernema carpocapsae TaxID=34508 RepID=A0A4U8UVD0_STECR|nr:hypothetical protein L596_004294 [Steinernema carpocapsae]